MAHNPPRVWITEEQVNSIRQDVKRRAYKWGDISELADKMLARAKQGKRVVLSPGTAEFVANALKRGGEPGPEG